MRFYLATSFIFPRSFRLRLFAICFVATHLPLLSYLVWATLDGRLALPEVVLLTLATVAGTALALIGVGALLEPIHIAAGALSAVARGAAPDPLPPARDIIGDLFAGVDHAVSATEARARALELAAKEDVLTGIHNRRGFLSAVQALAPEQRRGALALVDIDYFKQVNDQLGHAEGDRVLRAFAARLSAELRRQDVLARWGGEEFAILFCGALEDEAARVLDRIEESLQLAPLVELDGRPLTFSAGVSRFQGELLEEAIRLADEALYEAKRAGRARICRASTNAQRPLPLG